MESTDPTGMNDPLLIVSPRVYVEELTGIPVPRHGKIPCPFHNDRTPSLHVYDGQSGVGTATAAGAEVRSTISPRCFGQPRRAGATSSRSELIYAAACSAMTSRRDSPHAPRFFPLRASRLPGAILFAGGAVERGDLVVAQAVLSILANRGNSGPKSGNPRTDVT